MLNRPKEIKLIGEYKINYKQSISKTRVNHLDLHSDIQELI
jgi:hypothetical protein